MESKELEDLFDDIRQTCGDCGHPRCLSIIKSAKASVTAEVESAAINAFENKVVPCYGCNQMKPMVTRTYDRAGTSTGYVCQNCFNAARSQPQPQKDTP